MAIEYDRVLTVGAFGGSGYDAANGARSASAMPDSLQFGFDLSALSLFKVLSDSQLPRRDLTEAYRRIGDELLRCFWHQPKPVMPESIQRVSVLPSLRSMRGRRLALLCCAHGTAGGRPAAVDFAELPMRQGCHHRCLLSAWLCKAGCTRRVHTAFGLADARWSAHLHA